MYLLPTPRCLFYSSGSLFCQSSEHTRYLYESLLYQYWSNHDIETTQEVKEGEFNVELLNSDERVTMRLKETLYGTRGRGRTPKGGGQALPKITGQTLLEKIYS